MSGYRQYRLRLESDATLDILKMDHIALILAFIQTAFREEHSVTLTEGVVVERLTALLEEINTSEGSTLFDKPAGYYLEYWAKQGVLGRRHTDALDIVYSLTPAAERAYGFAQGMERRTTVGAESKLKLIARTLQDLAEHSDSNVNRRIELIERRITELREEQHALNLGTPPKLYTPVEKLERYRLAIDLGRDLQRDFGLIRERFKVLARTVAEQYSATGVNRGDILRRALEDDAILRRSPEGQSFAAFQLFLLDPDSQREMRRLVEEVEALPEIDPEEKRGRFLRDLPSILLVEAQAVVATNERLSGHLRRVLDSSNARSRAEAQALMREIMTLAYAVKQSPPEELIGINDELETTRAEAMVRPPWREPMEPPKLAVTAAAAKGDEGALAAQLAELVTVDFDRLNEQIAAGFAQLGNGFTLAELVEAIPPAPGIAILDLLGYLELARRKPAQCRFRLGKTFRHPLGDSGRALLVPDVEFYDGTSR